MKEIETLRPFKGKHFKIILFEDGTLFWREGKFERNITSLNEVMRLRDGFESMTSREEKGRPKEVLESQIKILDILNKSLNRLARRFE